MLQRLLGHMTLMMPNRYCQAVGCKLDHGQGSVQTVTRQTKVVKN